MVEMMNRSTRVHVLALASLCAVCSVPVLAQSMRSRVDELGTRIEQVERVVQSQALVELAQRMEVVVTEARQLRGEIEILQNENEVLRKQQREVAQDFDKRIAGLETPRVPLTATPMNALSVANALPSGNSPLASPAPVLVQSASLNLTPELQYGRAFDALKAGNYAASIDGMSNFLQRYPQHPLASNAQYWLGQTYYVTRDYENAVQSFSAMVGRAGDSLKIPDAMLKRGLSEIELKRTEAARLSLAALIARYPDSAAARLAIESLQRLP